MTKIITGLLLIILSALFYGLTSCNTTRSTGFSDLHESVVVESHLTMENGVEKWKEVCRHFFVRQSYTEADTIQVKSEWHPCVCIHCGKLNICK